LRTIALTLLLFAAGCGTLSSSSKPGETQDQLTVQVAQAPPADKAEDAKPVAPGFGYIWVAGYWDYLDGNYIWRSSRWVQGKPDYEYVRARYDQVGQQWTFHRPHWKRRHAAAAPQSASAQP
jgi:hypothetical protein